MAIRREQRRDPAVARAEARSCPEHLPPRAAEHGAAQSGLDPRQQLPGLGRLPLLAQEGSEGQRRLDVAGLEAERAPQHVDAFGPSGTADRAAALREDDGGVSTPATDEVHARGLAVKLGLERKRASRLEVDGERALHETRLKMTRGRAAEAGQRAGAVLELGQERSELAMDVRIVGAVLGESLAVSRHRGLDPALCSGPVAGGDQIAARLGSACPEHAAMLRLPLPFVGRLLATTGEARAYLGWKRWTSNDPSTPPRLVSDHGAGRMSAEPMLFVCHGCGAAVEPGRALAFRCPRAAPGDDIDHVLAPAPLPAGEMNFGRTGADEPDPFLRYRALLSPYRLARAAGLPDGAWADLVGELDLALTGVDGRGFRATPLARHPALARAVGVTGELWVKDATGDVSGSH